MDYAVIPSLEDKALLRTVILFWSRDDIRDLVTELYFRRLPHGERERQWQGLEDKVLKQMSKLLPKLLKTKAIDIYKEIGLQIAKFINYHETLLAERRVVRESLTRLSWTSQGLIDRKKTAKILIKDEILNINARYVLACVYCLEDDILKLWDKIPKSDRALFRYQENPLKIHQWDLVVVWTHDLIGEIANLNLWGEFEFGPNLNIRYTAYQYAFEYAAEGGNRAAAEYFLQKVTPEIRRVMMWKTAKYIVEIERRRYALCSDYYSCLGIYRNVVCEEYYADVFWFLLSQIDGMESLIESSELVCFLHWPFQDSFLKILSRLWRFLSQDTFIDLLSSISSEVKSNDTDRKYRKVLREFWEQSPTAHKRNLLNKELGRHVLIDLFKTEEENYIKLIFKDVTEGRKDFICSDGGLEMCIHLFDDDKWHLMDFFIRECISSKREIINFQQAFTNHLSVLGTRCVVSEEKLNRLCQHVNNFIREYDKRENVEE